MPLGKQAILGHSGMFTHREVHMPAWKDESGDDVVLIRGMTIREFEVNQASTDKGLATAAAISRCVMDASGGRVFTNADIPALAEMPMAQMTVLFQAIAEESGLNPDSADPLADGIADAEGNSATTTSDASSSA